MSINTVRNYLNGMNHGPNHYYALAINRTWFDLKERDNNDENIHPYHLYIRYDSNISEFMVGVYFGTPPRRQAALATAMNRLAAIQQAMQNDARWAGICQVLHTPANWGAIPGGRNITTYLGFHFDNPNGNQPPTQPQLAAIKDLVDLIFENF